MARGWRSEEGRCARWRGIRDGPVRTTGPENRRRATDALGGREGGDERRSLEGAGAGGRGGEDKDGRGGRWWWEGRAVGGNVSSAKP